MMYTANKETGIFISVIPPIVISAIFQSKSALSPAPKRIIKDAII